MQKQVAKPPQRHSLSPKARRALELLVNYPVGVTGALMQAKGFTPAILAALVGANLAMVRYDVVKDAGSTHMITRYHITDTGWKALKE